jgi:hypothetical protein
MPPVYIASAQKVYDRRSTSDRLCGADSDPSAAMALAWGQRAIKVHGTQASTHEK